MLVVAGHFRIPAARLDEARPVMQAVVSATLEEPGCLAYSYAEDVAEPGLFRVSEIWEDQASLSRHFATPHMQHWTNVRDRLGFCDREITVYSVSDFERL
ncbi:hypothetical protein MB02_05780 [Croceicoccus estronivorus]|uniref:putative quinol monooxygenase n=1 Tax=Croceicoccus estronivorus TaxID=1172626 RepID=UPI0008309AD8|nr:putative quinol monooxygenase [Croceicoccus estronivorus]OCC24951.1 hypothetical protein MB02_05780 [Croceicoccus estronivorus]